MNAYHGNCPYCGSNEWDKPVRRKDGSVCTHPTKMVNGKTRTMIGWTLVKGGIFKLVNGRAYHSIGDNRVSIGKDRMEQALGEGESSNVGSGHRMDSRCNDGLA